MQFSVRSTFTTGVYLVLLAHSPTYYGILILCSQPCIVTNLIKPQVETCMVSMQEVI